MINCGIRRAFCHPSILLTYKCSMNRKNKKFRWRKHCTSKICVLKSLFSRQWHCHGSAVIYVQFLLLSKKSKINFYDMRNLKCFTATNMMLYIVFETLYKIELRRILQGSVQKVFVGSIFFKSTTYSLDQYCRKKE